MKLKGNSYVLIAIMVIMLFVVLWSLFGMEDFASKLLPLIFGSLVLILAAILLRKEMQAAKEQETTVAKEETSSSEATVVSWRRYLANFAWIIGFTLGIFLLGFLITIPLFILAYMKWLGTSWRTAVISAVLTTAVAYFGFERALQVDLYPGFFLR